MYYYITNSSCIYNFLISLIFTEIREGVAIRRGSVLGDFPLYGYIVLTICINYNELNMQYCVTLKHTSIKVMTLLTPVYICRRQHRKDNYLHLKPFRGNNNIMNLIIHMIYIYTTFF